MKEVEMKELETLEAEAIEVETLDHVTLIDTEMNTVVGAVVGAQVTAEIANDKREKGEAEAVAVATKDPSIIDQETIVTLKMTTVDPENQDEIETLNENLEDVTRKIIKEVPTKVTKIVIMKDLKMEKEMNK